MNQLRTDNEQYNEHFLNMLTYRRQIRHVLVVAEKSACTVCRNAERVVSIEDLPVLPHRDCDRRGGCGCWYAASARGLDLEPSDN